MSDEPVGFLARWWRRKEAARQYESAEAERESTMPIAKAPPVSGVPAAPAVPEESEEEAARRLGLPDIDSLDAQSDYSLFMRDEVPEGLQQKALRKLWRSDPVLANRDGLDMYQEDYTDAATVVPDLRTLYRVGRGYLIDEDTALSPVPPAEAGGDAHTADASTSDAAAPADHRSEVISKDEAKKT